MVEKLLSTGEAAALCSVTPDTVRKWISAGRLPSSRTPGGHHRIERQDLERLVDLPGARVVELPTQRVARPSNVRLVSSLPEVEERQFQYCWEYNGRGSLLNGCARCAVFKMRALRCYEVVKHDDIGHNKVFCQGTCDDCDYFRRVHLQETNVLVVSSDDDLVQGLTQRAANAGFNLMVADCEYACSSIVDSFRPDFAVVDCALGHDASDDICQHLLGDPRIPFVRLILAAAPGGFPTECNRDVFAQIEKPFGVDEISACVLGVFEER